MRFDCIPPEFSPFRNFLKNIGKLNSLTVRKKKNKKINKSTDRPNFQILVGWGQHSNFFFWALSSCARQNGVNAHVILPGAHRSARHMRRTFDTCFTLSLSYHLYVLFVWISYQARFGLKISYPAIVFTMVIGLLNCGSFIIHILLLGTSKVFTLSVFLPCACVHVLLPGTQRYYMLNKNAIYKSIWKMPPANKENKRTSGLHFHYFLTGRCRVLNILELSVLVLLEVICRGNFLKIWSPCKCVVTGKPGFVVIYCNSFTE